MVNTGKPSGACINCRERRIKCDEAKPVCVKCIRSGRTCAGYSQGFKLRDQTQKTIIKAKFGKGSKAKRLAALKEHKETKETTPSPQSVPSSESSPALDGLVTHPRRYSAPVPKGGPNRYGAFGGGHRRNLSDPIAKATKETTWPLAPGSDTENDLSGMMGLDLQSIHMPLVDRARCYFLSSYVVYCPNKSDTGMLTFIPSLLASSEGSSRYFQDMFSAVSIAAFSMRPNCRDAANATHLYYGAGVRGLRKALEVGESAKSDTVLATTILLGVYEGLAYGDAEKIAYTQHFRAALELLRLRGPEQFSSKHGTEMFDLVMESLVRIYQLQLPWKERMRQYDLTTVIDDEDISRWSKQTSIIPHANRPHLTSMRMLDLRSKLASLLGSPRRDSEATRKAVKILMTAQEFEKRVSQYYESEDLMAKKNLWVATTTDENADLVYPDWWTATRWLNKYAFRLLICHIIADVSAWLAESTEPWPQNLGTSASETAKEDIKNIIASIPYLCSWRGMAKDPPKGAHSPCGSDDAGSVEGITNLMVIWPLVLAAESQFVTPEQRDYVQGRLKWIGQNMGVKHAAVVSENSD
ncbi:hypothetical protein J7T55_013958 [Diaporthe amygdali]|uniref:uncharacterized protein n=1 Tax=Phomopsis amygdali TaxID=1214568 RepID=UPI0022FE2B8E|nr:uncharacterized protein J7T55_013958 [Diaporthe amygdali]KAJ0119754.1 hypothetical protein J7T55_013958 [Diaporthe amygdali]